MDVKHENIKSPEKHPADIVKFIEDHPGIKIISISPTPDGYEVIYVEANVPTSDSRFLIAASTGDISSETEDLSSSLQSVSLEDTATNEGPSFATGGSNQSSTPLSGSKKQTPKGVAVSPVPTLSDWAQDIVKDECKNVNIPLDKFHAVVTDLKGIKNMEDYITSQHALDPETVLNLISSILSKLREAPETRNNAEKSFIDKLKNILRRHQKYVENNPKKDEKSSKP